MSAVGDRPLVCFWRDPAAQPLARSRGSGQVAPRDLAFASFVRARSMTIAWGNGTSSPGGTSGLPRLGLHLGLRQEDLRPCRVYPRDPRAISKRHFAELKRGELRSGKRDLGGAVLILSVAVKNANWSVFASKPFRLILPDPVSRDRDAGARCATLFATRRHAAARRTLHPQRFRDGPEADSPERASRQVTDCKLKTGAPGTIRTCDLCLRSNLGCPSQICDRARHGSISI